MQLIVHGQVEEVTYQEWRQFYETYLQSDWWKTFARQVKTVRGLCEAEDCGIDDEESRNLYGQVLNVHHLRYDFYNETDDDVQVLCPYHHKEVHSRVPHPFAFFAKRWEP